MNKHFLLKSSEIYLQHIDIGAYLELLSIHVIIRIEIILIHSRRGILTHPLGILEDFVQIFYALLTIVRDPIDFILVYQPLFFVNVLPVDHAISEDLQPALVVREAWVLASHSLDQIVHIPALGHLSCKYRASLRQLKSQFDH